jgi:uncharacterized protein (DUF983 family)
MLRQLCPHCRMGRIFSKSVWRGFPRMNERCPVCGLQFEREQGYFLGAMYISFGIGIALIALFATGLWIATNWSLQKVVGWGLVLFLPFVPPITLFSRVLWIYLDRAVDPGEGKP